MGLHDVIHNFVDALPVPHRSEDRRSVVAHELRVAVHNRQVGSHCLCKVDLVDDEHIRLGDSRASFPRHLVAPGDVDHVDREIGKLSREIRGEVVSAALAEQQGRGRVENLSHSLEGSDVTRHILADRSVRTPARLDGADALRGQDIVLREKLGVFFCEDIVRHHAQRYLISKIQAKLTHQRRLPGPHRPSNADGESPLFEISLFRQKQWRIALRKHPRSLLAVGMSVSAVPSHEGPGRARDGRGAHGPDSEGPE
mmetsp:Transcript_15517/g.30341  ORF Transcript_15517/g.30341 Transcript_15517/m.30341 type:complete len:255 (+) Transcript_15517:254-1018(+)